jgi:hypothetical protein
MMENECERPANSGEFLGCSVGEPLARPLPIREQARQVLRRIHESNVRLSFGPGMHVMTPDKFVFDAVLEALEAAEARALAAEERASALEVALRICVSRIEKPNLSPDANWVLERARAALASTETQA